MVRRELKQPSPACLSSGFGCDNEIAKIGVTRSALALTLEGEAIWFELTTNYFLIDHDAFSCCFEQSRCPELRATVRRIFSALQVSFVTIQQA